MNVVGDGGEKSNIVIDGLTFERTAGGGLYFFSNDEGGVGFSGIVVRNCTVTQTGTGHIDDGSYHNGIHYSQHTELPTAPIFEHNRISFTGNHGNGINSQNADNAQLLDNDVSEFNHSGLDMKNSSGVIVRGNLVHDSFDTNAIYQEYCTVGLIENNLVYNVPGTQPGRGSGIQIDVDSTGARIFNNSIYNVLHRPLPAPSGNGAIQCGLKRATCRRRCETRRRALRTMSGDPPRFSLSTTMPPTCRDGGMREMSPISRLIRCGPIPSMAISAYRPPRH